MRIFAAAIVSFLALSGAAHAGDVAVYGGAFSALRSSENSAAMGGAEYRFAPKFNGLRPTVGAFATTRGSTYVYGGATWELPLNTGPFVIAPGLAAGYYNQSNGKDLGSKLEFRSTMEVTYKMQDGKRIGAQISHLSNAGIDSRNPGTESVQVIYSQPF